jgi:hypothetical protein
VKTDEIIDYAMPLMNVERLAKDVYSHALSGDLKTAHDTAMQLSAEVRILQRMLELMMEKT